MKLKISLKNHLRVIHFNIIISFILLIFLIIVRFNIDYLIPILFFYTIISIPIIYLHFEYFFINKNCEIIINDKEFIVLYKKQIRKISFDQINLIYYNKSASLDTGGIQLTPIESYNYIVIKIKNGEDVIITCLMYNNIDTVLNAFTNVRKIRIKFPFPTVFKKSNF